jgi:hypothetical protein
MRKVLEARGLLDATCVGFAGKESPGREVVGDLAAALPEAGWVVRADSPVTELHGQEVRYLQCSWKKCSRFTDPDDIDQGKRVYGWRNPLRVALSTEKVKGITAGGSIHDYSPLGVFRLLPLGSLTSVGLKESPGVRGFGPLGADFWHVVEERGGRRAPIVGRYPDNRAPNLNYTAHRLLVPGRRGPVASVRFECLREGLQEVEARIFIEKALTDPAKRTLLGDDFARRCRDLLDEQFRAYRLGAIGNAKCGHDPAWYAASGWQERSARIYRAAAEVAGKLPAN